ncbi:MAG: universal stress protein [Clostridia bacterium]|nr:universal stress protein UspA [Clostridiales bacterium]MBQ3232780.1 universal stress protein [Clostridia bacterium]MBQ6716984.1 universal stress protein [Clostridia bacterium]
MAGHVLVCVTGQKTCEALIVEGARIAKENGSELSVLHVVKPGASLLGNAKEGEALEYLYKIATEHDADMAMIRSDNVEETIARQAEKLDAQTLVIGKSNGSKEKSFQMKIETLLPDIEIKMVYP